MQDTDKTDGLIIENHLFMLGTDSKNLEKLKDKNSEILDKMSRLENNIRKYKESVLEILSKNEKFKQAMIDSVKAVLPEGDIYSEMNFETGRGVLLGFSVDINDQDKIKITYTSTSGSPELSNDFENEIKKRASNILTVDMDLFKVKFQLQDM